MATHGMSDNHVRAFNSGSVQQVVQLSCIMRGCAWRVVRFAPTKTGPVIGNYPCESCHFRLNPAPPAGHGAQARFQKYRWASFAVRLDMQPMTVYTHKSA